MMDSATKSSLVKTLQKEFVRRNLICYFEGKGYDNFLVKPYPPSLMDIVERIEVLSGIVEVKHHLEDINMQNNIIKVGWNLFVLGNQRAFLGYTNHKSVSDIESAVGESKSDPNGSKTIKELIEWVVEVIGSSKKLKDLYEQYKLQDSSIINTSYVKPYKSIPNFKRRV